MSEPRLHHLPCDGTAGAHRMAWWSWGDPQASQVVVCVHGLTRQGRDFDVLARSLLERATTPIHVVCPDIAGRGHSDWLADADQYQLPVYVADMLALLAHLEANGNPAWFDWVGTSMGGLIGMAMCGAQLQLPAPVRRLVLNDVGPTVPWEALQRIRAYVGVPARFDTIQHAADAMAAVSVGFGPHTPDQWMALAMPMVRPLPEGGFRFHYDPAIGEPVRKLTPEQAADGEAQLWQLYDRIRAETLVLRGSESDLLSRETALAMSQRGPKARLVEFAGIGHAPTLVTPQQIEPVASFLLSP